VAAFFTACDLMEEKSAATLSPAEMAARAQATVDSATRYKDSLAAYRKADSLAWVAKKTQWKTDSLSFITKAKTASDLWKKDSAAAVKLFKTDSGKARKQFVKDSTAWSKDSVKMVTTLTKDSAAWVKKRTADSAAYEKAVAAMAKKLTADSTAMEKLNLKWLTLLGKDSAAITAAQEAYDADTTEKGKAAKAIKLEKANTKLAADWTKYNTAVEKLLLKRATDSTKGEENKQKQLDKRAADSVKAATKYTSDSTKAAAKITTRLTTWASNNTRDSTKMAADTAAYALKLRTAIATKVTKDSLDSLTRRADSTAIAQADSALSYRKAVPVFSIASGNYTTTQSLTLTTTYASGKIYYTVDGTTPDTTKTLYSSAISLPIGKTVLAVAYTSTKTAPTRVFGQTYVIDTAALPTVAAPYADTADSINVILTSPDTSDLYYTFNGSAPTTTESSTNFKASLVVTKDTIKIGKSDTIKVMAVKTGRLNSPVVTQGFLLTAPAPHFNKNDTTRIGSFYVQIADTLDPAVTIRYTTNGTTPTLTNGTVLGAHGDSVLVDKIMQIKAVAYRTGVIISPVVTRTDTVQADSITVDTLDWTPDVDTSNWTFTLPAVPAGQTIRYIVGASPADPTSSTGTLYTAGATITLPVAQKIKVIAVGTSLKTSKVKTYSMAKPSAS
jgi:hypothetical protein